MELTSIADVLQVSWQAFYRTRWAAVFLWIFGTALITSYFFVPAVEQHFQQVALWKKQFGFLFSAISTGIFGGLAPIVCDAVFSKSKSSANSENKNLPDRTLLFYAISNFLFWAIKGMEIDLWYQVQSILWGNGSDVFTIVCKTFLDQFIYVPIFGIVNAIWFYRWREIGYRLPSGSFSPSWTWYKQHVLAILVSNWFVWVPAVAMIYCLPPDLQLPIQNLILCLWVMMLSLMAEEN